MVNILNNITKHTIYPNIKIKENQFGQNPIESSQTGPRYLKNLDKDTVSFSTKVVVSEVENKSDIETIKAQIPETQKADVVIYDYVQKMNEKKHCRIGRIQKTFRRRKENIT